MMKLEIQDLMKVLKSKKPTEPSVVKDEAKLKEQGLIRETPSDGVDAENFQLSVQEDTLIPDPLGNDKNDVTVIPGPEAVPMKSKFISTS